jgi:heat shock protein HtpX
MNGAGVIDEARNRGRITTLLVLATLNYCLATALAAVAVGLGIVVWAVAEGGVFPDDADSLKIFGIGVAVVVVVSATVGLLLAVIRIPLQRRRLERRVLAETGARLATPDDHPRVRNLLEGLAIAADLPVPRFAVIDDPAPNSFGVGTRPKRTIIAVTTGLIDTLSRDELEAILAYEVSRTGSWDVALASWTVALTGEAITARDADDVGSSLLGWLPQRLGEWLQAWALRGQARERDATAIAFTRNPASLVRALEKLDEDPSQVGRVSRATAPLWVEFPARVLGDSSSRATRRLARELLLDERIDSLRELAGLGPRAASADPPPAGAPTGSGTGSG